MIPLRLLVVTAVSAAALSGVAVAQASEEGSRSPWRVTPLPRALEVALARSALPPHLRADATVHVLNPASGFEVAREGSNGYHALVARTDPSAFRGSWPFAYRDDILLPIAFDRTGAEEHMRVYTDVAELQARGTTAAELKRLINERYHKGGYGPPQRAGVAYMLAPILRGYRNAERDDQVSTVNFPHYMFYAPDLTNEEIGGTREHVFVFNEGPHGYMIHLASEAEREAINREHAQLLAGLCQLRSEFCLAQPGQP